MHAYQHSHMQTYPVKRINLPLFWTLILTPTLPFPPPPNPFVVLSCLFAKWSTIWFLIATTISFITATCMPIFKTDFACLLLFQLDVSRRFCAGAFLSKKKQMSLNQKWTQWQQKHHQEWHCATRWLQLHQIILKTLPHPGNGYNSQPWGHLPCLGNSYIRQTLNDMYHIKVTVIPDYLDSVYHIWAKVTPNDLDRCATSMQHVPPHNLNTKAELRAAEPSEFNLFKSNGI